jgi:hypothetical protein
MRHFDLAENLKRQVAYRPDEIDLGGGLRLTNHDFRSRSASFPGRHLPAAYPGEAEGIPADLDSLFATPDHEIEENRSFRYHVMRPSAGSRGVIILLHGFNERLWDKYLPMAARLALDTGRAVVMFPIAFHMNRSPDLWRNARVMAKVSQLRKRLHPDIIHSTLSNAAISVRLHADPSRFFWSGLQSYEDLAALAADIRHGRHPGIEAGASVHLFTYSIGTLLGEIAMMTDPDGLFSESRFVTLCGGPVFNRLSPVSKFILDSEANVRLYSFLIEHLDSHRRNDPALDRFLGDTEVGRNFLALLNYRLDMAYREDRLRSMAGRFLAVALARDEVVPPFEVVNTLQGSNRDIGITVEVVDPPYPHRHEDPFPVSPKHRQAVDDCFDRLFGWFCDFLR